MCIFPFFKWLLSGEVELMETLPGVAVTCIRSFAWLLSGEVELMETSEVLALFLSAAKGGGFSPGKLN